MGEQMICVELSESDISMLLDAMKDHSSTESVESLLRSLRGMHAMPALKDFLHNLELLLRSGLSPAQELLVFKLERARQLAFERRGA